VRVVLDTNIWVSGLMIPNSQAGKVLAAWKHNHLSIVTSSYILEELSRVLSYPKIRKRFNWDKEQITQFVDSLKFLSEYIELKKPKKLKIEPRDEFDIPILQTLIASQADYLISGDNDLLELKEHYSIMTLAAFVSLM
tara:strand:+ start:8216 stop:8629 length:414 start_codon:yes stop_codon:yes gene_type:complete